MNSFQVQVPDIKKKQKSHLCRQERWSYCNESVGTHLEKCKRGETQETGVVSKIGTMYVAARCRREATAFWDECDMPSLIY